MTGPEFREWRISEKEMTQVELSAYLGVTVKTISHWENEHTKIPKIIEVLINEKSA